MPGYRFCRTDDVPLLVRAGNLCCAPHAPAEPPFTVESWKTGVRELSLWASSCMVAMEGEDPLGVLLAAKRESQGQTLIHRIGVRPGHLRKGHGRHMMTSLSSKLSILGPPRLVAEVPADRGDLRAFLEACGYAPEAAFTDFVREAPAGARPPDAAAGTEGLAAPITLQDLTDAGALTDSLSRSWERSVMTLAGRAAQLRGMGIASDRGFEAWVLWRALPPDGTREIGALGCAAGAQGRALLGILVLHIASGAPRVIVPRLSDEEMDGGQMETWGFRKAGVHIRYAAEARP